MDMQYNVHIQQLASQLPNLVARRIKFLRAALCKKTNNHNDNKKESTKGKE